MNRTVKICLKMYIMADCKNLYIFEATIIYIYTGSQRYTVNTYIVIKRCIVTSLYHSI